MAVNLLGLGLQAAARHEETLSVQEAEFAMKRRIGVSESSILVTQSNIATTYFKLERFEQALNAFRDAYSGNLKLHGKEHHDTLLAANNYTTSLTALKRFEEAKALFRKLIPVAQRVLGEGHDLTLKMRSMYARALYRDPAATLDELREAVTTLVETERTARRVFGGAHPTTELIKKSLHRARAALAARETPPTSNNA